MKYSVMTADSPRRIPVLSLNRFSRNSGMVSESPVAMVYRRRRLASSVHASQAPNTIPTAVHRCIIPAANASAGKTSIVQPLVADDAELSADVMGPSRRPAST